MRHTSSAVPPPLAAAALLLLLLLCEAIGASASASAVRIGLAVPTRSKRHHVLDVGRATWRAPAAGVTTVVSTDDPGVEHVLPTPQWTAEVWVAGPDVSTDAWKAQGGSQAEQRYTALLRNANATLGDDFDWLLYGDDDVIWLLDNVQGLVAGLDAAAPLYLTDGFLSGGDVVGCSRLDAPPSLGAGGCTRITPSQPCTRDRLLPNSTCYGQQTRAQQPPRAGTSRATKGHMLTACTG